MTGIPVSRLACLREERYITLDSGEAKVWQSPDLGAECCPCWYEALAADAKASIGFRNAGSIPHCRGI